ncbi:MAG: tetraacyldisaccharide 4'-kinase, partial [Candidatus Binatia bacterium]
AGMSIVRRAVDLAWLRRGAGRAIRILLLPASALFSPAVRLRALLYRLRLVPRARLDAAVVSVGNLSVGGTGKTPTALWVAERLRERGYRVAILSRGYGGAARRPTIVGGANGEGAATPIDWRDVGDENVLLARRFAGSVVVGRRRAEAGRLARRELGADVLVLDDGFQHLRLRRDFDLVCVRAAEPAGDLVLPAGRLREPSSALRRADAVLLTKGEEGKEDANEGVARRLARLPVFRGELRAVALVTSDQGRWRELPIGQLAARRSLAVSGLADPQPFYRTLHDWGARVEDFLEFPDHHVYTLADWKKIAFRSRELESVVTTEKDLVKLEQFPFAKDKLVAVRVVMDVEEGERLIQDIAAAVERRLEVIRKRSARRA